jgi:hypothetical protein
VNADDDLGVAEPDHVAVGKLPLLHRCVVHRRPVGGIEIRQQRDLAVPPDLQMPARHPGVGQPELGVLAAADHIGAFTQLVGPAASVVELQGDGGTAGRVVALAVAGAVATGLALRTVVVAAAGRLSVARLGIPGAGRGLAVTAVIGLGCVTLVLAAIRLAAVAALIGVAALLGVAALVRIRRARFLATVATVFGSAMRGLPTVVVVTAGVAGLAALRRTVAAGRLPVALIRVTALWGAVARGRTLFVGRRRVALVRVAALLGVALPRGIALTLWRVAALFLRWVLTTRVLAAVVLAAVPLVVILVGRPPLSLAAAVARVVAHRWYS